MLHNMGIARKNMVIQKMKGSDDGDADKCELNSFCADKDNE